MKAEDWLRLSLQVVGVLVCFFGFQSLLDGLLLHLGYFTYEYSTPGYYLVTGLAYIFIGLYLMRGASSLVRFAYPSEDADEEDEEDGETEGQKE
ncbi:MAG TPA: hypothetical protein VD861_11865 [Pyrinomonadaceae bacterium]|nr:hypothetical protein [Pyrinomonadaceae bacterium]